MRVRGSQLERSSVLTAEEITVRRRHGMETPQAIDESRRSLRLARRVVVKAGTPVLTHVDGRIALGRIGLLVEQIALLRQEGRDVIMITSGAISTGLHRMRRSMTLTQSIQDSVAGTVPHIKQEAAAAVGQSLLMSMYENLFSKYNMSCAQVLITEEDMHDGDTLSHVCDTIVELLSLGIVPIINDNDAVTGRTLPVYDSVTNEVQWDNDVLAAMLSVSVRADLLIMLTDLDALYTVEEDGGGHGSATPRRLQLYREGPSLARSGVHIDPLLGDGGRGIFTGRTRMSAEGLRALVQATCTAIEGGVRAAVITTGHHPLSILKTVRGDDVGTLFLPQRTTISKL